MSRQKSSETKEGTACNTIVVKKECSSRWFTIVTCSTEKKKRYQEREGRTVESREVKRKKAPKRSSGNKKTKGKKSLFKTLRKS